MSLFSFWKRAESDCLHIRLTISIVLRFIHRISTIHSPFNLVCRQSLLALFQKLNNDKPLFPINPPSLQGTKCQINFCCLIQQIAQQTSALVRVFFHALSDPDSLFFSSSFEGYPSSSQRSKSSRFLTISSCSLTTVLLCWASTTEGPSLRFPVSSKSPHHLSFITFRNTIVLQLIFVSPSFPTGNGSPPFLNFISESDLQRCE